MTKYCSKCGKENDDNSKFCGNCGEKLSRLHAINKIDKYNNKNDINNKEDKKQTILIGVVIVLLVAVAIVGAYAFMAMNDNINNDFSNDVGANLDTNNVDTASVTSSIIPLSEVYGLAKAYSDSGWASSVTYYGVTFTNNQCLYIFAKAIDMKYQGTDGVINFGSFGDPDAPSYYVKQGYITKSEYVDMAQRTYRWMDNNDRSPNYIGIHNAGSNDFGYEDLIKFFAQIIIESENSTLPSSIHNFFK